MLKNGQTYFKNLAMWMVKKLNDKNQIKHKQKP